MSIEPVADGELGAIVTYLEMREAPDGAPIPSPLRLQRLERPGPEHYRRLFRLVGERWLWFSRLLLDDARLSAVIGDTAVEVYAVIDGGDAEVGLLEVDFRQPGECELAFLGLVPRLAGQGHGRWLLTEALRLAWRPGVERVHVHTCSLDHPAALAAYRRAGFVPYKRAVERFADPRLIGILPRTSAPQVPLLGTETSAAGSPASCT